MKSLSLVLVFTSLISCSKVSRQTIEPEYKLSDEQSVSRKLELLYILDGVKTPVQQIYPAFKNVITKTQVVSIHSNKTLLAKYGNKAKSGIVYLTTSRN